MRYPIWCLAAVIAAGPAHATHFTYHGELLERDAPADGAYDLRVRSFAQPGAKATLGETTELIAVPVLAGGFSVDLDLPDDADGTTWVEVAVRPSGSHEPYAVLGAPQPVTKVNSTCAGAWALDGNAGAPAGSYLGFADATVLQLRAANDPVARFESFAPANAQQPSVILGSSTNTTVGRSATVLGGTSNLAGNEGAVVVGGIVNRADGANAVTVGGGFNRAGGLNAVTLGGGLNCAGGDFSFAGGSHAVTRAGSEVSAVACLSGTRPDANGDEGTFIWADSQAPDFISSGPNQFLVRADGGLMLNASVLPFPGDDVVLKARPNTGDADFDVSLVTRNDKYARFYVAANDGRLQVSMPQATGTDYIFFGNGARLTVGGTFTNASSRTLKHAFAAVDASDILQRVLRLPITSWEYRASSAEGRHVGPVAEDFRDAFGLGSDGRSIATADADGVALAAIQGLNAKLEAENAALRATLDSVMRRLDALEADASP